MTRFNYWMHELKPRVLEGLKKADIEPNSDAGKHILKFHRRIATITNLMYRLSWETICNQDAYFDASELLYDLNGGYGRYDAKYSKQWESFCNVTENAFDADLSDWLA